MAVGPKKEFHTDCEPLSPASRAVRGVLALGIVAGLLALAFLPLHDIPLPPCAFKAYTGYSCLTCGMTRSVVETLHGRWGAAVGYHPFGPVVILSGGLLGAILLWEAVRGARVRRGPGGKWKRRIPALVILLWAAFGIVRLLWEILFA